MDTITDNFILDVIEDTSGRLWVGTQEGLNLFDRETDDWLSFKQIPAIPIARVTTGSQPCTRILQASYGLVHKVVG